MAEFQNPDRLILITDEEIRRLERLVIEAGNLLDDLRRKQNAWTERAYTDWLHSLPKGTRNFILDSY